MLPAASRSDPRSSLNSLISTGAATGGPCSSLRPMTSTPGRGRPTEPTGASTPKPDATTGAVRLSSAPGATKPDYETSTSHSVTVRATSTDGSTVTRVFTINVTDVNESGVGAISDTDGLADSVAEDAAVGVGVGVTAYADDPDGTDTVTYSLDSDAGGLFTIDANTGEVLLKSGRKFTGPVLAELVQALAGRGFGTIIVVDDGSDDGTSDLISAEHTDHRIRLLRRSSSAGVSSAEPSSTKRIRARTLSSASTRQSAS